MPRPVLTQAATEMTIEAPFPLAARLFGLPFLAVGGYLLFQLLSGGGLTIAGFLLLPLMTAAFLVPGWLLSLTRKRVQLDAAARELAEVVDLLVYRKRTLTPIPSDAHVVVRHELQRSRDHATLFCQVELAVAPGRSPLVALFEGSDDEAALACGQQVASFLGLRLEDRRRPDGAPEGEGEDAD